MHGGLEWTKRARSRARNVVWKSQRVSELWRRMGYGMFLLKSGRGHYKVILDKPKGPDCTCPDFTKIGRTCKHLWAVIHTVRGTDLTGVESDPAARSKPRKQKTYKQDWPRYNPAQMEEGHEFPFLLSGVCSAIEGRPRGVGRPLLPWSAIAFACASKIYSMKSGRRASSEIWDAHVDGFLDKPVHYNTISAYLRNPDLSDVLRDLIFKSSLPSLPSTKFSQLNSSYIQGFLLCL